MTIHVHARPLALLSWVTLYSPLFCACTVTEKTDSDSDASSQSYGGSKAEATTGASGGQTNVPSQGGSANDTTTSHNAGGTLAQGGQSGIAGGSGSGAAGGMGTGGVASATGGAWTQGGATGVSGGSGPNASGGVATGGAAPGGASNPSSDAGRTSLGGSVWSTGGSASNAGGYTSSTGGYASTTTGGSGISTTGGTTAGAGGATSTSAIPSELVGVWQQTRATSGDYTSQTGMVFSLSSGFTVQLKLSSNGAYYLANFGAGVAQNCASVSNLEQSTGTAEIVGNAIVFHPTAHVVDVVDCTGSRRVDLGLSAFSLTISVQEAQHFYGGIRTYRMLAEGGPHPYDLMLLHRPPLANPPIEPQPADFVLGTDGPYQDFQGLWVAAPGTDSNFFDPATGEYYFPELNGSPHAWLRMVPGGYETAIALQNVNSDGPCKSDIIYYEQGEGLFAVLQDVGNLGNHFVGDARLQSTAARLIVRIRECGENDGVGEYDLPPVPRYFRFIYFSPDAPPESISFPCDYALNEWQSILCEAFPKGFIRR